jgi:hypothetical protein
MEDGMESDDDLASERAHLYFVRIIETRAAVGLFVSSWGGLELLIPVLSTSGFARQRGSTCQPACCFPMHRGSGIKPSRKAVHIAAR